MRKGNLLDNPVYEEKRIYLTIYGKKATIVMNEKITCWTTQPMRKREYEEKKWKENINEKIKPVGQPSL